MYNVQSQQKKAQLNNQNTDQDYNIKIDEYTS